MGLFGFDWVRFSRGNRVFEVATGVSWLRFVSFFCAPGALFSAGTGATSAHTSLHRTRVVIGGIAEMSVRHDGEERMSGLRTRATSAFRRPRRMERSISWMRSMRSTRSWALSTRSRRLNRRVRRTAATAGSRSRFADDPREASNHDRIQHDRAMESFTGPTGGNRADRMLIWSVPTARDPSEARLDADLHDPVHCVVTDGGDPEPVYPARDQQVPRAWC